MSNEELVLCHYCYAKGINTSLAYDPNNPDNGISTCEREHREMETEKVLHGPRLVLSHYE